MKHDEQTIQAAEDHAFNKGWIAPSTESISINSFLAGAEYAFSRGWIPVGEITLEHNVQYYTFSPIEGQRILTYGTMPSGFPSGVTHAMPLFPQP